MTTPARPRRRRALLLVLLLAAALVVTGAVVALRWQQGRSGDGAGRGTPGTWTEPHFLPSARLDRTDEQFYFVMTDRFANGNPGNDTGGLSGDRTVTGFDPTDKGFYHGGDLAGLMGRLDYIKGLGTTGIWLTPTFVNKPVQGSGAAASAGYHGYWVTDFTRIDPHLGTNEEMKALIDKAHAMGMRVYFDIITNHTADVIASGDGSSAYLSRTEKPYRDAAGTEFDDQALAAQRAPFPRLDATTSFPHAPVFPTPGDATVKKPDWLNDPTMYHNRGNSSFTGESSTYGDFFGLDDLFTERPEVVQGMVDIYTAWADMGIDGFRIDTVKHVNLEFWQDFSARVLAHVREKGRTGFFMFGEVNSPSVPIDAEYTTAGGLPATLDFPVQEAMVKALQAGSPRALSEVFAQDDLYLDADSNAYSNVTFLGNHDMGRIAAFLRPTGSPEDVLRRDQLAHAMLFLLRGNPCVYYGDEQGFAGTGGDKDARQDMFATQVPAFATADVLGSTPGARDRFDPEHPLYRTIATLGALRKEHPTLANGAQVERFVASSAGIYAVSRIRDGREYLVVLNTSLAPQRESFRVGSRGTLAPVHGATTSLTTGADGTVEVSLPGLSVQVYRAESPLPTDIAAPQVNLAGIDVADVTRGRTSIRAQVTSESFVEVAFWLRGPDGAWAWLGTDDGPDPRGEFGVSPTLARFAPGDALQVLAIARDAGGHETRASADVVVGR